jgi:hypothetical protein
MQPKGAWQNVATTHPIGPDRSNYAGTGGRPRDSWSFVIVSARFESAPARTNNRSMISEEVFDQLGRVAMAGGMVRSARSPSSG